MFEVADTSASEDGALGCPVVNVTDRPDHLVLFLTLLYDGVRHPFFLNPLFCIDFQDLRAIALLSCKYDVQHMQAEVSRRLQVCYPATLEQWDLRYPHSLGSPPENDTAVTAVEDTLRIQAIDSIAVINLARRLNLKAILPIAYFICAMQLSEDIIARVRYGEAEDDIEELSHEDVVRCLRGRDILIVTRSSSMYQISNAAFEPAATCSSVNSCTRSWKSMAVALRGDTSPPMEAPATGDILRSLSLWANQQQQDNPLCTPWMANIERIDFDVRTLWMDKFLKHTFSVI